MVDSMLVDWRSLALVGVGEVRSIRVLPHVMYIAYSYSLGWFQYHYFVNLIKFICFIPMDIRLLYT